MSEPKLISPLLDGFSIGTAISDHDGVCCAPAVKENSENKFIVKVISIPASQTQLDALLLTGAYQDPAAAMDYFKELTQGVLAEAECLKKLAKLEGFLAYDSWQVVPMERNKLGYDVYLVGSFKKPLDRYMRKHTMTHLEAVNLGLDMCAALAIARRAGWMYVDLKPSNIFVSEDREYRIGDLGFIRTDSLQFSSLPRKYCSPYSAPEAQDVMSTLNDTIDTYSVGMLLYQIYNNGQLPPDSDLRDKALDPPANADYEMAEIILKACAPKPADRWSDPVEMGQALVAYMQRNTVNDVPIVPPTGLVAEEAVRLRRNEPDETLPSVEDAEPLSPEQLSEEASEMVNQADELISHEAPAPVVVPEPTPMEELQRSAEPEAPEIPAKMEPLTQEPPREAPVEAAKEDPIVNLDAQRRKNQRGKRLGGFLSLLLVIALLAGGWWYYQNIYLLPIHALEVEPGDADVKILLDTQIDNSLLSVVCTDIYGNTMTAQVSGNQAVFTDLLPDMLYKIRVQVDGFHALEGSVTHEYMTPSQTKITSFTAAAGSEEGTVQLRLACEGQENQEWILTYETEGEEPKSQVFTGQTITLTGLQVRKTYVFRLSSGTDLKLTGQTNLEFTVPKLISASNLQVATGADTSLTVTWDAPEDAGDISWTVHCYSSDGYDATVEVTERKAIFKDLNKGSSYTIEVLAEGMTQPVRINVTADPATITALRVDDSDPEKLTVIWDFDGSEPATGWILLYTIDGSDRQEVVKCQDSTAVIETRIPGASYQLTIQAADGSSVFENTHSYKCPNATVYENNEVFFYADTIDANLLKTPGKSDWSYKDVSKKDYTASFASGQPISLILHHPGRFYLNRFTTRLLYVIRDSEGNVLTEYVSTAEKDWRSLWENTDYRYCELDLPAVPTQAGEYTLYLYFNGYAVTALDFTITE